MSETVQDKVDFLVIANRLPVDRKVDDDGSVSWKSSPGGLVTALEPVMQRKGGAWIGWHGAPDEVVKPFHHDGYDIHPVPLSAQEVEEYYEGFSNATLWPLYHDCIVEPVFHREWWDAFQKVNKRFAEQAAEQAAEGATVWVQDYQLNLVPKYLREMRPDLRIGFFITFRSRRLSFTAVCRGAKSSSRACWELTSSGSRLPELLPISSAWQGTARGSLPLVVALIPRMAAPSSSVTSRSRLTHVVSMNWPPQRKSRLRLPSFART